ncbi:hypothetical protein RB597_004984 [Gaeumannomyces tritici]
MAIIMTCQDSMPGFDDVHTPASEFNFSQATTLMPSPATGIFPSFSQTGPADLAGSTWDSAVEGTQNFPDFQDHGAGDSYSPFTLGHTTPTHGEEDFHSKWSMPTAQDAVPVSVGSEPMRRLTSRSSTSSHRHSSASSKARRRLRATLAQAPELAYSHMTGNGPITSGRMVDVSQYLGMESTMSVPSQSLYSGLNPTFTADGLPFATMTPVLSQHVDPTCTQMDFEPAMGNSPAHSWDSYSTGLARTPSPGAIEDAWIGGQRLASSPNTTGSSPVFPGQSPRYVAMSSLFPQSLELPVSHSEDVLRISRKYCAQPMEELPSQEFSLPPAFARIGGSEIESPRDHALYKQAVPHPDGMFHCPWEGDESCNHKPEKLKCNYDKFVDSHLKPYRCKLESCENARFSSTACLLRHEREAHGMHGHGDKPFMCTYEGCDRAQPGNGFPRHWNLKDHMKRVHNDTAPVQIPTSSGGSPPPSGPSPTQVNKNRKRKKEEPASTPSRKSSLKSQAQPPILTPAPTQISKAEERQARAAERWLDQQRRLVDVVSRLEYDDSNVTQQIKDAQVLLDALSSCAPAAKKATYVKGEYRRSYTN